MRTRTVILLFSMLLGIYLLTPISNRSEAEDAFAYAQEVEAAGPAHPHVHHLLYVPVMKFLYRASQWIGYEGRSHPLMVLVSAACGAGSVVMVGLLSRRLLDLSLPTSILTAGWFGAAYGCWRYACEAEIYAPATFFALLTVYLAGAGASGALGAGVVAGLSILVHVMNALAAFLVGTVLQRARSRTGATVLYSLVAVTVVALAYGLTMATEIGHADGSGAVSWAAVGRLLSPTTYVRGLVGFGQSVVSGNFLFAVPAVREQLPRLFPYRAFEEELQMGAALSKGLYVAAFTTTALLAILSFWLVATRLRLAAGRRTLRPGVVTGVARLAGPLTGLWFAAYGGFILIFEPGNPEMWIMGLPPLFLFLGYALIEPVVQARGVLLPACFLATLIVHNSVAGIAPLAAEGGDYIGDKAAWLVEHGVEGDAILTAGSATFSRYLRYHTEATVVALNELRTDEMEAGLDAAERSHGAVYALDDVFAQPPFRRARFPGVYSNVLAFAEAHRRHFEPLPIEAPCTVYVLGERDDKGTSPF